MSSDAKDASVRIAELTARCQDLEARVAQLGKINAALMERVEFDTDAQGGSFGLFQMAIALEGQVRERTAALQQALHNLAETNRDLQASNEAAQQANRAKSEFLAAMSHELRTPMNGVVGMVEVLLNSPLDDDQRGAVLTIRNSALSLLRILNDILDFSKIEAGHLLLEDAPFDLRQVLASTIEVLKPQMKAKGLELRIDWPESLPSTVLGDSIRFSQIVTNLVGNAIKFTSRGWVAIRARAARPSDATIDYRFEVSDTGLGIKAEVIPRLFNSFSQADSTTTREYGGTGLGLAIVRRLCTLMGCACGVTSEYGKGSCFWFELPFRLGRHDEAASSAEPVRSIAGLAGNAEATRRLRVLVVEDNPTNQVVAMAMLKILQCDGELVENGQLALERLSAEQDFDLVLMDCQMPVMDGFEATRHIRSKNLVPGRHLPIIALTANAMVGDREDCLSSGMDDFLSKPFQLKELEEIVNRWCPARSGPA